MQKIPLFSEVQGDPVRDEINGLTEANEQNQTAQAGATASVTETSNKQGKKYPVLIRWEHGGFLSQEPPADLPYADDRSLSVDETMHMSKRQIKNLIAYREGVEQGINDRNRMELKVVDESLRNRLFDIIKNVLPDNEKDQMLRFRLKKTLRDTLEHIPSPRDGE